MRKYIILACLLAVSCAQSSFALDAYLKSKSLSPLETMKTGAAIGAGTGALAALTDSLFPFNWLVLWLWGARDKIADAVIQETEEQGNFVDSQELKKVARASDWIAWAAVHSICSMISKRSPAFLMQFSAISLTSK